MCKVGKEDALLRGGKRGNKSWCRSLKGCVRVCEGEFFLWNLDFCVCSVSIERDGRRRVSSWCYLADGKYFLLCDSCSAIVGLHLRGKMHVFFLSLIKIIRSSYRKLIKISKSKSNSLEKIRFAGFEYYHYPPMKFSAKCTTTRKNKQLDLKKLHDERKISSYVCQVWYM